MIAADRVKTDETQQATRDVNVQLKGKSATRFGREHLYLAALISGGVLLVLSLLLPYWTITLHAPQYPMGLDVGAYTYKLTGDVSEVDGLNHYIGMTPLNDAATIERAISRIVIPIIAVLAVASFWMRGIWRWLAITPVISYPIVFVVDLAIWLYYAGHSLDPTAALSSSIKPFTPRVFGSGAIGQFTTSAQFQMGFYLALVAAALVLVATIIGRPRQAADS